MKTMPIQTKFLFLMAISSLFLIWTTWVVTGMRSDTLPVILISSAYIIILFVIGASIIKSIGEDQ